MSNGQDKDEILAMAREADDTIRSKPFTAEMLSFLERFATLCRAPLVAELERLTFTLNQEALARENVSALRAQLADEVDSLKAERGDWKARALKSEQAVAEWQGSADGGKSWRRIDKPRGESIESRVAHLRNMTNSQGRPIYLIRALYTTPKPAAQEPTSAVPVVEQLVEASTMLLSYTLACEGLLNAKPAGQIDIAQEAIAAGQQYLKESGK
jgi:hypothetical protein